MQLLIDLRGEYCQIAQKEAKRVEIVDHTTQLVEALYNQSILIDSFEKNKYIHITYNEEPSRRQLVAIGIIDCSRFH